jgi:Fucose permease
MRGSSTLPERRYLPAFVLLGLLVMLWGIGHRFYETLMPQFTAIFALAGARKALTEGAYQIVYVVGAIPAALLARSFGYKTAIQFGLGSVCIGAFTFYPASETQGFAYFLFAVMLMAFGWIILEVSVNTLILRYGAEATAVRRLNLAQTLYPIGSLAGIFTGRWIMDADLVLPKERFAYAIAHPYIALALAVLLLAYLVEEVTFPPSAKDKGPHVSGAADDFMALIRQPMFRMALVAQAANIFALGISWFMAERYFRAGFHELSAHQLAFVFVACLAVFGLGRLLAAGLMWVMTPAHVLELFTAGGCFAALAALVFGGQAAGFAALALSFFLGPAWPTIFGLALEGQSRVKLAAAIVTLAGALGAVAYHFLEDKPSYAVMAVAALSAAVMFIYAAAVAARENKPADKPVPMATGE